MTTRLEELININHATVEDLRTIQRNETVSYSYKMHVSDAKRLVNDPMGYEVVRALLRDGDLVNHHFVSRFDAEIEFISMGCKTLVVNHQERSLYIQE